MKLATRVLLLILVVTLGTSALLTWLVTLSLTRHETSRAHAAISEAIAMYQARLDDRHGQIMRHAQLVFEAPAQRSLLTVADDPSNPEARHLAVENLRQEVLGSTVARTLADQGVAVRFHALSNALDEVLFVAAPGAAEMEPVLAAMPDAWRSDDVLAERSLVRRYVQVAGRLYLVVGVPLRYQLGEPATHAYFLGVQVDDGWAASQALPAKAEARPGISLAAWFTIGEQVVARASSAGIASTGVPSTLPMPGDGALGKELIAFDVAGERFVGEAFALDDAHARLVVGSSLDAALAPLRRLQRQVAGIALAAGVVAIAVSLWVSRQISRPVEAMAAATRRIADGRFDEPVRLARSDEMGVLATNLNAMALGLKERERLRELHVQTQRELTVARQIQMNTLPRQLPRIAGYELAAFARPAQQTGGDTYDLLELQDGPEGRHRAVGLLLADATGHGIGPALSVTQVRSMLRMGVRLRAMLGAVLREINHQLCDDLESARFVTAFLGRLDPERHRLDFYSAGQGPILHYVAAESAIRSYASTTVPLGLMPDPPDDGMRTMHLSAGDILVLLTDGFYEYHGPGGAQFGEDAVRQVICRMHHRPVQALLDGLVEAIEQFAAGHPQQDDMTAIVLKRVEPPAADG